MNDTVVIKDLEVEILTGCGPDDLGYGTGIYVGRKQVFTWDWPDEATAMDGHEKIKTMLQIIADALRERPLESFDTAYYAHY